MPKFDINGTWIEADTYIQAKAKFAALQQASGPKTVRPSFGPLTAKQQAFWDSAKRIETNISLIIKPDPAYDFIGHATNKLGIGEKFTVKAVILVPGVTITDLGGLEWQVISGASRMAVDKAAGTMTAVATDKAGVKLKVVGVGSGLSGRIVADNIAIPVVEPQGVVSAIKATPNRGGPGLVSSSMELDYWLTPSDVSFAGIEWQEPGGEAASFTGKMMNVPKWGFQNNRLDITRHGGNPNTWMGIQKEYQGRKNYIQQTDTVSNTFGKECAPGTFTWIIQWAYRVKNPQGRSVVFKRDVVHRFTATVIGITGTATISKAGSSHSENFTP